MNQSMSFEAFERYLKNNQQIKSVESYLNYLQQSIKYLGVATNRFFSATLFEARCWEAKLKNNTAFQGLSYEYRSNIVTGYHAYLDCLRDQAGLSNTNN